jgi:DNA-binding SARP family transcriptional activator/TolB-like protein/Tfp pilus assembly protein PilF
MDIPTAGSASINWHVQHCKRLSLRLFGEFELTLNVGSPVALPISSRKGRALIAYLALHPEHRASREQLATLLWGDRHDVQARQDLRQCLRALRRDLKPAAAGLLAIDAHYVALAMADLSVDALDFAALASSAQPDFECATALYRGELLCGLRADEAFGEWLSSTRNHFEAIAANIFESCARDADARGCGAQAIDAVDRLAALDPMREDRQRLALELYARHRGRGAALSRADRLTLLMKNEFDTDVDPLTKALVNDIRCGAIEVAAGRSASTLEASCLPPQKTSAPTASATGVAANDLWRSLASNLGQRGQPVRHKLKPLGVLGSRALTVVALAIVAIPASWLLLFAEFEGGDRPTNARLEPALSLEERSRLGSQVAPAGIGIPIVVLPFLDGDADGRNEQNAASLADDLTSALAQNSELQVVSQRSTLVHQGRSVDFAELRTRLGVRYIVDGGLRTEGAQVRVSLALVDAAKGSQVWSDQFAQDADRLFELRSETVARLARDVQFGIALAQGNPDGQDLKDASVAALVQEGRAALLRDSSLVATDEELALFEQTMRREPDLPAAQLGLAMTLVRGALNSLTDEAPQSTLDRADELLNSVLQREPTSYEAYYWKGLLHKARGILEKDAGQYHSALGALQRALELNPNAGFVHAQLGAVLIHLGRAQEGMDEIQYAIRLNPRDPSIGFFYLFAGEADLEMGHDAAAIDWFKRATDCAPQNPSVYRFLSAGYALIGDRANMEKASAAFRRFSPEAAYWHFVDGLRRRLAGRSMKTHSRTLEGLRIAFAP